MRDMQIICNPRGIIPALRDTCAIYMQSILHIYAEVAAYD